MRSAVLGLVSAVLAAPAAFAHVGSPDVFFEGTAGPYRLYVTVRPPAMIPGVAEVEIRSATPDVTSIGLIPLRVEGPASRNAPAAEIVRSHKDDPQFFTGGVWLMGSGSWQVRVQVEGGRGRGEMAVPVPAAARRTLVMQGVLGAVLFGLMLVLGVGLIAIVGAAARESRLLPGAHPGAVERRRGRVAMAVAAMVVVAALGAGNWWWTLEARERAEIVLYRPPAFSASVLPDGDLVLRIGTSSWHDRRNLKNLIPDHGHLMHLFVVRAPGLDRFAHLHPDRQEAGLFKQALPPLPAGRYALFADLVYETGFPVTLVAEITLPEIVGKEPQGDDSQGAAEEAGADAGAGKAVFPLPDGSRMVWVREGPLAAKRLQLFRFRLEDGDGTPATDVQLYMGMPGHAAFVRRDLGTFAHVHPAGSVAMPALALAEATMGTAAADPHASHANAIGLPPEVTFPYGFPTPGDYRIFVQVKRGGRIQTGVFDAHVPGSRD
jgi:hypothetical protein